MSLSICDKAKTCDASLCCDQAQKHDCGDYACASGCKFDHSAKCVPFVEPQTVHKPVRVRAFKEDIVRENVLLKMRVHQLECDLKLFVEMPTMRRIVWAWKGGNNV